VNSKEENSQDFCLGFVQEFGLRIRSDWVGNTTEINDPIQQLFVDKINKYSTKKTKAGGKLVDATAAMEADFKNELDKVAKAYSNSTGVNMTFFSALKFSNHAIDPINIIKQWKAISCGFGEHPKPCCFCSSCS
jgi:hypothetical protein